METSIRLFIFICTFFSLTLTNTHASVFGKVKLAQNRLPIDLKQFKIMVRSENKSFEKSFKIRFKKNSVQWIRNDLNLLTPRALIEFRVIDRKNIFFAKYLDQKIILNKRKKYSESSLYINLFQSDSVYIYQGKKQIARVFIEAAPQMKGKKTQLIDYSCSRYNIKIKGLDNEYVSVGCRIEKIGEWHGSSPRLQISWSATNFELLDGTSPPFIGFLSRSGNIVAEVRDRDNRIRTIEISAKLPKKMPRMFTAYGLGPYALNAVQSRDNENIDNGSRIAPALFLYGKYELAGTSSLKFFDAFIANKAIFNNAGFYFSYQLAEVWDGRISVDPLLGLQLLSFRIDKDHKFQQRIIYPQGFEFTLKHAFGIENYNIIYGMFISPSNEEQYQNLWVRWGKGYFWELNYIGWNFEGVKTSTYGLSIGLPLATFF